MNGSQLPPRFPSSQEVHVWIAKEDLSSRMVSTFSRVLTEDELKRINKLRFQRHRLAHVFAKGMLRHILARYLDVQPSKVVFILNSFGKPFLCPADHAPSLMFNMSHSDGLVVLSVAINRHLGIDVELVRVLHDRDGMVQDYFTDAERAIIAAEPADRRDHVFYTLWTRKEAYVKAIGKGLSIRLNSVDVSFPEGVKGRNLDRSPDLPSVSRWWLSDLSLPHKYMGALVVEGCSPEILYVDWDVTEILTSQGLRP